MNILLGITGSVATTLVPKIQEKLVIAGHDLKIVATDPALYFLPKEFIRYCPVLYRDKTEWPEGGYFKNDPVKHIEFRDWADVLLIAPLTANTLAKMANGIADNFLCCIARAWPKQKPVVIAPAMNTEMWIDPITQQHIDALHKRYFLGVVEPVEKMLACGERGLGAMADIDTIVKSIGN